MSDTKGARARAKIIVPDSAQAMYDNFGFAPAVEADGIIYVSGVISKLEGEGSYAEQYTRGFETGLKAIDAILKEAGASLDDVVEMTTFHTEIGKQAGGAVAARKSLMSEPHSSWTAIGTTGLVDPAGVTEIKVIAHR